MFECYLPRKHCDFFQFHYIEPKIINETIQPSGQHQVKSHQNQPITTVDFCHSTEILTNKLEETRLGCVSQSAHNDQLLTNSVESDLVFKIFRST